MSVHEYNGWYVGRAQRFQSKITGRRGGMQCIPLERLDELLNGKASGGEVKAARRAFNPPRIVVASRAA